MTDYELDVFFKELEMEQDIFNYVHHNKVPNYLQKTKYYEYTSMKHLFPELDDITYYNYNKQDDYLLARKIQTSISKCDNIIKEMMMPVYEPDTCPVCMCEFEETNYVIPKCGHKVCAVCFTNNIKHNKATGDCCVLCRKRVC